MFGYEFYVDPSRCIGCGACEAACSECETHRGVPLISVDFLDRNRGTETVPTVCMHCDDPTCAEVCPADAIKKTEEGIVLSALKPRCVSCSNCVLACPFGVPKYVSKIDQMMKCDQCYDRTSAGKRPMCVTVCPNSALAFGRRSEIEKLRRERPIETFHFDPEMVRTKVQLMMPGRLDAIEMDVADLVEGAVDD